MPENKWTELGKMVLESARLFLMTTTGEKAPPGIDETVELLKTAVELYEQAPDPGLVARETGYAMGEMVRQVYGDQLDPVTEMNIREALAWIAELREQEVTVAFVHPTDPSLVLTAKVGRTSTPRYLIEKLVDSNFLAQPGEGAKYQLVDASTPGLLT